MTSHHEGRPSVTTVIATHHRPELLRAALDAVIAQEYEGHVEVVVVFDQSEPDTSLEFDDPDRRIRVVSNRRSQGLAGARNTGIEEATGDLVAFCDDDDIWFPKKLHHQVSALEANPDCGVASCGLEVVYGDLTHVRLPTKERLTFADLLDDRVMEAHPSTILVRRDLLPEIGDVDEALPGSYAEDYEWLLRAAKVTGIVSVNEALVRILWGATSYFTGRFEMIAAALNHLLDEYPEFETSPKGKARILGQIAFAEAGAGRRSEALAAARECVKRNPREPRAVLAVGVAAGVLPANWVIRQLNQRGRGI